MCLKHGIAMKNNVRSLIIIYQHIIRVDIMIKKIDSAQTIPKLAVSHRDRKAAGGLEKVPPTRIPAIGYCGIDSVLRADSRPASCCLRSSTLQYLCNRLCQTEVCTQLQPMIWNPGISPNSPACRREYQESQTLRQARGIQAQLKHESGKAKSWFIY